MSRVVALIFSIVFLASASHADEETKLLDRKALAIFYDGKSEYNAFRFTEARDLFEKSERLYIEGTAKETEPKSLDNFTENARLLRRWIVLSACQENMRSGNIDKVRISLGQARGTPPHHGACLAFPDYPGVKSYALKQLEWLSGGKTGVSSEAPASALGIEKPPTIKLEADAAVLAETKNCRSDQNNRDARSCFYEAMDRGGGIYNFRMNKDCPTELNYLAVVFVRETSGTCTRQVKNWTPQTPGKNVLVTSPGGTPEIKDAVIVRPDDDITACYIKRHNGRPC